MAILKSIFVSIAGSAALCIALASTSLADTVITDAKGKLIGSLWSQDYKVGTEIVTRRVSPSTVIYFGVYRGGLAADMKVNLLYISADCSGPAYIAETSEGVLEKSFFVPTPNDEWQSTNGTLIYPAANSVQVTLGSLRVGAIGDCQAIAPGLGTVHPAVMLNVTSWNLIAPFRVK